MSLTRLFISLLLLLSVSFSTGGLARPQQPALEPDDLDKALDVLNLGKIIVDSMKPIPKDSPLQKLQRERCRQRALAFAEIQQDIQRGLWEPGDFFETLKLHASLFKNLAELTEKPEDKVSCYELRVTFLKEFEHYIDVRVMVGSEPSQSRDVSKAARIDAEVDLIKLKNGLKKSKE